ncbi:MAG: SBBP repeat-containing protein, partial [Terracidiphilus sp.]
MYAALPMSFEANAGQTDSSVKFLVHAPGYSLFLTNREAVLSLLEPSPVQEPLRAHDPLRHPKMPQPQRAVRAVRVKFLGGNEAAAVAGTGELPAKSNYFIGNDPKQWHTNVPNYSAVKYSGIYPGVDAVFHGDNRRLEFDFDIAPGASARSIALEVDGARRMRLNRAGGVVIGMDAAHELVMNKPHIYQQLPEGRREIAGNYVLGARHRIAFALGAYDHSRPLVIDPTIVYSTYLGGSVEDFLNAIAADSSGSAYLAGEAFSPNFPVTDGAYQTSCTETGKTTCTSAMAYVAKLSPDGSSLLYATFLNGHSAADSAWGIAVDPSGSAYVLGEEEGELDFPTTTGAFQPACNVAANMQPEVFVAKLDPTGSILDYSTCLQSPIPNAASNFTEGTTSSGGIAVDSDGNAYVTGVTDDPQDFPTTQGTFQTGCVLNPPEGCNVSADPFVTKIDPTGQALLYSTFLSTGKVSSEVNATGIAVDSLGNAYVIGNSDNSNLITTPGSFMPSCPSDGCGGFVAKINGNATVLVYSTYLGGSDFAYPTAVAVDQNGSAYVTGYTGSTDFPVTVGALQYYFTPPGALTTNEEDGFVVKVGALGDTFAYATFLAGTSQDTLTSGIAVDAEGHAFVTGIADPGFPTTTNAFQTTDQAGANQAFFSELDPGGASLLYSTFLAGTSGGAFVQPADVGSSYVATDASGNAYVAGITDSSTFPTTPGAYLTNTPLPGGSHAATGFVAKFAFSTTTIVTISPTTLLSGTAGVPYSQ